MSIIISGQDGIDLNGKKVYDGTIDNTAYTIETISEFTNVPYGVTTVIVKDINCGGTFVSKTSIEIDPNTGSLYVVNECS